LLLELLKGVLLVCPLFCYLSPATNPASTSSPVTPGTSSLSTAKRGTRPLSSAAHKLNHPQLSKACQPCTFTATRTTAPSLYPPPPPDPNLRRDPYTSPPPEPHPHPNLRRHPTLHRHPTCAAIQPALNLRGHPNLRSHILPVHRYPILRRHPNLPDYRGAPLPHPSPPLGPTQLEASRT
jgi:hypothetical protein